MTKSIKPMQTKYAVPYKTYTEYFRADKSIDILISEENNSLRLCYNAGNGYVKIFTRLSNFEAYLRGEKNVPSRDVTLDEYNSDNFII